MLRGFRLPDGVFAHYPVFSSEPTLFRPSQLLSIDDEVLSSAFIMFASACMLRNCDDISNNCILSPIVAPDAMLKRIPPCRIMASENDCLRDESYEMALRILKLQGSCRLIIMKDYIHAFNNFDRNLKGVEEYRRAT